MRFFTMKKWRWWKVVRKNPGNPFGMPSIWEKLCHLWDSFALNKWHAVCTRRDISLDIRHQWLFSIFPRAYRLHSARQSPSPKQAGKRQCSRAGNPLRFHSSGTEYGRVEFPLEIIIKKIHNIEWVQQPEDPLWKNNYFSHSVLSVF